MGFQNPFERLNFPHAKCYMSGIQSSGNCVPNSQILTRVAVEKKLLVGNGHTFYHATCCQIVLGGNGKWEMGNVSNLDSLLVACGKCHPLSLEHRKLQGPKKPAGNSSEQHAADGKRRLSSALCFHSQVNRIHLFSLPTQLGNRKREIGSRPLSLRC